MFSKFFTKRWQRFTALTLVLVLGLSAIKDSGLFEVTKNLEIFTSVYKEVHLNYVEDVNPGELMKTGINAMLASLDPYTNYYTEAEVEDALIKRKGDFGTPGIEITLMQNKLVISAVKSGSSADLQGVKLGDVIQEINGRDFSSKSVSETYESFEGAVGSFLKIKVKRGADVLEFNLERKKPDFSNVPYYGMVNKYYGYIKLDQFMDGSADEVKQAFLELRTHENFKGLILDLRNNGGGLLIDAIRILNLFIDKDQLLVITRGKTEEYYQEYKTFELPLDAKIPLVVLINENSASASEIVAGTIQDLDRGVVIGHNSYGKGLVQNVIPLPYRNQVKVTIAKYFIPSGRCIQEIEYSKHKHKDSAGLTKPFYTKNRRVVYEGAGIKPDVVMEKPIANEFMKALRNGSYIFEFASEYYKQHPDSVDIGDFKLSPNVFEDFRKFCQNKGFMYKSQTELEIDKMQNCSVDEQFNTDIEGIVSSLNVQINKSKEKDWERYKEVIMPLLNIEIAKRYYGEKSLYPIMFHFDKDVKRALGILDNPSEYSRILKP
ncbi:MAG: S41 family peptidase [Bacteroidia bacterium]|nr:S41 family peptidase [Bacteroidia bacterium]MCO5253994.1 S41 family peptidase [Bacteroidota bacterium]